MSCTGTPKVIDFVSDDEIVQFFISIDPDFCMKNLPSYIRPSAAEMVACKTNTEWELSNDTLYVSGNREEVIICPRTPIVELTDITIVFGSGAERSLKLTDEDREIQYACDTGVIRLLRPITHDQGIAILDGTSTDIDDINFPARFPQGLNNIRITGLFGNKHLALLKLLQLLFMGKTMQILDSDTYSFGKFKEKIGRYEYQLGSSSKSTTIMSFDDYIQFICELLPDTEGFYIGSI